jgi:integration host factor subunit beta
VNRSEIILALQKEMGLTRQEAGSVVRVLFEELSKTLARGDRVELRGLCSFHVKKYRSYTGVNPKSGQKFRVKSKRLPVFKCGSELKKRVNQSNVRRSAFSVHPP